MKKSRNPILLIGGTGRSGTTNLCRTFAEHPEVTNIPELRFWIDPDGIIDFYSSLDNWSPYIYDRKLKRLEKLLTDMTKNDINFFTKIMIHLTAKSSYKLFRRYAGASISTYSPNFKNNKEFLLNKLKAIKYISLKPDMELFESKKTYFMPYANSKNLIEKELTNFLRNYVDDVLQEQDAKYLLEKNTWNILFFDKILKLLPESRLVHVYRDPRSVVASFIKQPWLPDDVEAASLIYASLIDRWNEIKKVIPAYSFIEVSLEEINKNTKGVLSDICNFWEIPFSSKLLVKNFRKDEKSYWKKDLSENQIKRMESILRPYIIDFKYD